MDKLEPVLLIIRMWTLSLTSRRRTPARRTPGRRGPTAPRAASGLANPGAGTSETNFVFVIVHHKCLQITACITFFFSFFFFIISLTRDEHQLAVQPDLVLVREHLQSSTTSSGFLPDQALDSELSPTQVGNPDSCWTFFLYSSS